MKYCLKCIDDHATVELTFEAVGLQEVIAELERFLRASGFYFHGSLEVAPWDDHDSTPD